MNSMTYSKNMSKTTQMKLTEMIEMINEMFKLIREIDEVGSQLNSVKSELRKNEFDLKCLKSEMEFSSEYEDFREGLKVKEIPPKILEHTKPQSEEICMLKEKRDDLEHELYILKLQFEYTKEVIDDKKQ